MGTLWESPRPMHVKGTLHADPHTASKDLPHSVRWATLQSRCRTDAVSDTTLSPGLKRSHKIQVRFVLSLWLTIYSPASGMVSGTQVNSMNVYLTINKSP